MIYQIISKQYDNYLKLVRVNESNDGTPGNTSNGTLA